ncbi:uncharacterized protein K452DRAFT_40231 [Aplosporella prunicola CBS 121167]|uniref:Transmembrane protein n=1 Tax=Aplosporella prunicola CBS 121167 TaxID=1176127 RepID=A0A6A6BBS0_9PEZI|nr:uncharacterized protein K452DRAFT_40231 [Aplosporella prunicola CBS 121167]KAF2141496.1 hypothetical protein K452DRAFT_40231 [Aplosporella prunicola CBS 121167]
MSSTDIKIASIAFGFTLGFGYLTAWDAWKMTMRNRNPLRSLFVWMVWGELAVNLAIAIMAWLFLEGVIKPIFATFFFILALWVFEVQFILQIIVNRVAIISMHRRMVNYIRWGTVIFIMLVNISVFCIWIPAQMQVNDTYIEVNEVWDKITKVLIGLNDACLNFYFIQQVRKRLIANGLQKYTALANFNTRIILISVGMDCLIIGTMFLSNPVVFMQFHPIAYTVKLKIELSMTNLITRISQESVRDRIGDTSTSHRRGFTTSGPANDTINGKGVPLSVFAESQSKDATVSTQVTTQHFDSPPDSAADAGCAGGANQIFTKREWTVQVSDANDAASSGPHSDPAGVFPPSERSSSRSSKEDRHPDGFQFHHQAHHHQDDEEPLAWQRG